MTPLNVEVHTLKLGKDFKHFLLFFSPPSSLRFLSRIRNVQCCKPWNNILVSSFIPAFWEAFFFFDFAFNPSTELSSFTHNFTFQDFFLYMAFLKITLSSHFMGIVTNISEVLKCLFKKRKKFSASLLRSLSFCLL